MWSDYVLPAAHHYEKENFCYSTPHIMHLTYSDKAVPPRGDSRTSFTIAVELSKKIGQRAKARKFNEYTDMHGMPHKLDELADKMTMNGYYDSARRCLTRWSATASSWGTCPKVRRSTHSRRRATSGSRTGASLRWRSDSHPTSRTTRPRAVPLARREEGRLPDAHPTRAVLHRPRLVPRGRRGIPGSQGTPAQGGDYPFHLTSGHPRWSIHSMNMTNKIILNTHRGHPFVYINPTDAEVRGVVDDEVIELYNDMGSIRVAARVAPASGPASSSSTTLRTAPVRELVRPGERRAGHGEVAGVRGGYGHLRYRGIHWQPVPIDRAIRLDVRKIKTVSGKEA